MAATIFFCFGVAPIVLLVSVILTLPAILLLLS
jgi:hypothetical protein